MRSSRPCSGWGWPVGHWSALWCAMAALASIGGPDGVVAVPLSSVGVPLNYRDIVFQQTPIRIFRCPQCETNALILATETDVSRSKKSGFSDQRIAELEGMLMNNRMRRSGFSDQRIAEMEAMLMNSMKRPAQRAFTASEQSSADPSAAHGNSLHVINGNLDVNGPTQPPETELKWAIALNLETNPRHILELIVYPSAASLIIGQRGVGSARKREDTGAPGRPFRGISTFRTIGDINAVLEILQAENNTRYNIADKGSCNKHRGTVKVVDVQKRSGFSDQRMAEMETMVLSQPKEFNEAPRLSWLLTPKLYVKAKV